MICKECGFEITFEMLAAHNFQALDCSVCGSSSHSACISVHDLLENPVTAMVKKQRSQQVQVGTAIQSALHHGHSCIAEAGTGTGKTLAYLVPALALGKRVIISTANKALQDQIMFEDGPWVQKELEAMGTHSSLALAKGKSNFACLRNFEKIKDIPRETRQDRDDLLYFQKWLLEAEEGKHNADLDSYPNMPGWVNRARVTECGKEACSLKTRCGYFRNLRHVKEANVVVTNHSLVAAEYRITTAMGKTDSDGFLFGERDAVIFDEAHQLESRFENAWTDVISNKKLKNIFENLNNLVSPYNEDISYDPKQGNRATALMLRIKSKMRFRPDGIAIFGVDALETNETTLALLGKVVADIRGGYLVNLNHMAQRMLADGTGDSTPLTDAEMEDLWELRRIDRNITDTLDLIHSWQTPSDDYVYYVEKSDDVDDVVLTRKPVNIAKMLEPYWSRLRSAVFTSATMSTVEQGKPSFRIFQEKLGLKIPAKQCLSVRSPFAYKQRCATYITRDAKLRMPRYEDRNEETLTTYYDNLAREIGYWITLTRGNTLVLFASRADLEACHTRLQDDTRFTRLPLFAQGELTPNDAMRQYMEASRALLKRSRENNVPREGPVLLGLQSFWEGVSFNGPHLLNVIIPRVPFSPPSDPVFAKKTQLLGHAAFEQLSIYPAAIAMRQGTGRLLRTVQDAGIVVLLDTKLALSRWAPLITRELEVGANTFYTKDQMEAAWKIFDAHINRLLSNTRL